MISQVAEFIKWKLELDGGNIDELAGIIAEANTAQLIDALSEASSNMGNLMFHRGHSMASVIALDDYLIKEGWYTTMAGDKESCDPGIAEQDAFNKFNARSAI